MLPFAGSLAKWGLVSATDFAARFKDPFLRRAVPQMFAWPDIPMMVGMSLLAYMHTGNAAFPPARRWSSPAPSSGATWQLGGQIHYKSQVEKILVEDDPRHGDRAAGVRLYNDEVHRADCVISAADGRGTIFDMLDGEFADRGIRRTYDGHLPVHSQVQVSLGVNRDLSRRAALGHLPAGPADHDRRRRPLRDRRQALLLRPQPGARRQVGA